MKQQPIRSSILVLLAITAHHCGPGAQATPDPVEPAQPDPVEDRGEPRQIDAPVKAPVTAKIEDCKIVVSEKIIYQGDPHVDPTPLEALDRVAELILSHPELGEIRIEVHTDSRGLGSYNKTLSEERAMNVKTYLVSKGVPAESLTALGCGEEQPISSENTEEGWATNRRTEFHIVGCEVE